MLVKCPICGAHVPAEVAVESLTEGGDRYCSLRCAAAAGATPEARARRAAEVQTPPPRRLLVAVDGSSPSLRAVELAISLARATHGSITLLHAVDPTLLRMLPIDSAFVGATRLGLKTDQVEQSLREDAERQLEHYEALCSASGIPHTSRIEWTAPARAIAAAAADADLVVMGSRGLGALTGAALGSLSHRVIGEIRKPVLVVH
jgi:nucleotide-binding universal stress UspA family protein